MSFHHELLRPDAAYAPFGAAGPTMNAHELQRLQQVAAAAPGPQYNAGAPQVAQLVAALLARRAGPQS
jgi:hypothetical protein